MNIEINNYWNLNPSIHYIEINYSLLVFNFFIVEILVPAKCMVIHQSLVLHIIARAYLQVTMYT